MVREEREQYEKMPVYKGLEGFRLVEKMGDGAFSNVYKAIDRLTGEKVAVKVVRKYELNASQSGRGDKHLNPNFKKRPRVTEVSRKPRLLFYSDVAQEKKRRKAGWCDLKP